MSSKLLTLNNEGTAAAVTDAEISDIFSTAFSTTKAITGAYALTQRLALFAAGAAAQGYLQLGFVNRLAR